MREGFIHVYMRNGLRQLGWTLVAGEYPGGSDDELSVLNIMDPAVACDNSPDHRRHSNGEIIPDLIAYKDNVLLIIEAKPRYSERDRAKLIYLLVDKHDLFITSLHKFCKERNLLYGINLNDLVLVPALAFQKRRHAQYFEIAPFAHIYVEDDGCTTLYLFPGTI